jgi:hypothetical protein
MAASRDAQERGVGFNRSSRDSKYGGSCSMIKMSPKCPQSIIASAVTI